MLLLNLFLKIATKVYVLKIKGQSDQIHGLFKGIKSDKNWHSLVGLKENYLF